MQMKPKFILEGYNSNLYFKLVASYFTLQAARLDAKACGCWEVVLYVLDDDGNSDKVEVIHNET